MFKMSYGQARWRQYGPIGGHLNLFCEVTQKKSKTGNFSHFGKLVKYCYCNIYSERELLLFDHIPPSLIQYGASNLIFGQVLFFFTAPFLTIFFFKFDSTLTANN